MKEKTTCECGCEITKINLKRHQSSKSHLELNGKENGMNYNQALKEASSTYKNSKKNSR